MKQRGKSFTIYLIAHIKICSSNNNHCISLMTYRIPTVPFLFLFLRQVAPNSIACWMLWKTYHFSIGCQASAGLLLLAAYFLQLLFFLVFVFSPSHLIMEKDISSQLGEGSNNDNLHLSSLEQEDIFITY